MKYLFDLHVHTKESSSCSRTPAREMVHLYQEKGFSGCVVTDHYHDGFFDGPYYNNVSWEQKVDHFLRGYRTAKEEGDRIGFQVLLGMEINFTPYNIDFLAFGITERFLKENPRMWALTLKHFSALCRENGILIYEAHPFRDQQPTRFPQYIDGVEVYNGSPCSCIREANERALQFARQYGKLQSAGSDFHVLPQLARGGVWLPEIPADAVELAALLQGPVELFKTMD